MTMTTADVLDRDHDGSVEEIDPAPRPKRRTFTATEKLTHLEAFDAWPKGSEARGAYLRSEGLYSSHISEWRNQRDRGALSGLAPKKRSKKRSAEQAEREKLLAANKRLQSELERTRAALEITGKVHALLESFSESAETEPSSRR